jgi:hypothetical protein
MSSATGEKLFCHAMDSAKPLRARWTPSFIRKNCLRIESGHAGRELQCSRRTIDRAIGVGENKNKLFVFPIKPPTAMLFFSSWMTVRFLFQDTMHVSVFLIKYFYVMVTEKSNSVWSSRQISAVRIYYYDTYNKLVVVVVSTVNMWEHQETG